MNTPSRISGRELARQLVHFAVGLLALLLPWLPRWGAMAVAVAGIVGNLWVLPHLPLTRRLFRSDEPRFGGIILYPVMVLLLVAVLPYPAAAAAAWGVVAAGDAASGIAGRCWGRRRLPWNPRKTWMGSGAFLIAAFAWSGFLLCWCGGELATALPRAALASLLAAIVESLLLPIDDNVSVAVVAGAAFWLLEGLTDGIWVWALIANGVVGLIALALGWVRWKGFGVGWLAGTVIFVGSGVQGWSLLLLFFVAGSLATRYGYLKKEALGIAQEERGARGAKEALANTGVALAISILA
ncbi:MAG: DUF92 domain-containing protein, partial [Planctomycetota bacterium]